MQQNPLFPTGNDGSQLPDYLQVGTPVPTAPDGRDAAADLIRQKVAAIYAGSDSPQPDAAGTQQVYQPVMTAAPAQSVLRPVSPLVQPGFAPSRHQQFLQGLQASGRSPQEIQAAWHSYYTELPDHEKHEVWQEFYAKSNPAPGSAQSVAAAPQSPAVPAASPFQASQGWTTEPQSDIPTYHSPQPAEHVAEKQGGKSSGALPAGVADIKNKAKDTLKSVGNIKHKHYLHSLGFGIMCGVVVLVLFMFSFFNEVILSPFIQPSSKGVETPVIVNPANGIAASSKTTQVLIPKINVQIPVDYSQTTTNEASIETALDSAVVHYPTTVMPGQNGNSAFFGHSSNNIFNPGKYKFAFVLLHKLTNGDTFYLTYNGKTYAYEVISHEIVKPTDVGVLGPVAGQTATATLITCDPPGTSINRLVVVGKQISPDPAGNATPSATPAVPTITASEGLPGNGPTLFSRLWHSIF